MENLSKNEYFSNRKKHRKLCLLSLDGMKVSEDTTNLIDKAFSHIRESEAFEDFELFAQKNPVSVLKYEEDPYYQKERNGEKTIDILRHEVDMTVQEIVRSDIESLLFKNEDYLGCVIENRNYLASMFENVFANNLVTRFDIKRLKEENRRELKDKAKKIANERDDINSRHPSVRIEDQPLETREFVNQYVSDNIEEPELDVDVRPPEDGKLIICVSAMPKHST